MMEVTTPFISKMIKNQTLSAEKVEILNLQMAAKHGCHAMMERWMQVVNASWLSFLRPSKFPKGC